MLAGMITVSVILQVDPARVDYFMECIQEQAALSNTEPGCKRFVVSQKLDDPTVFTFQEEFVDEAALQAHYETPHFAKWKERTGDGLIVSRTSARGKIIAGQA
jgi:autoinducer 2-degrading protein